RGHGSKLLARAEELARQEGIDILTLSAALNAIDFYLAHDYELLALDDYAHRSGVRLKRGVMQKSLKLPGRSS
ncbi:MAG: GNAT family N-acetyltransferase, partial [Salinicola sp.]|uniref:GNAT family N-acetyltransferase n=1 Tax=Salinicola sp. TaxID=1978524 RepID=UPI001DCAEFE7